MPKIKKTALVTGAATRIGQYISRFLLKNGWQVIIHYNNSVIEAEKLVISSENLGLIKCNFNDHVATKNLIRDLNSKYGQIDLLINNASSFLNDNFQDLPYDSLAQNMAVNLYAPLILSTEFAKQFIKLSEASSQGRSELNQANIINILDYIIVQKPNAKFVSYSLSKTCMWEANKMMALDFAPHIRVNGIAPGPALKNNKQTSQQFEKACLNTPLNTATNPDEICNSIHYILNTLSLTGQLIVLDGGRHLSDKYDYK